jgi:hypothetical protein
LTVRYNRISAIASPAFSLCPEVNCGRLAS